MGWLKQLIGWWSLLLALLLSVLAMPFSLAMLELQEVSYDPSEAWGGQYNEWIELWNQGNETINLSGCFVDNKPLPSFLILPDEFIIIARKPDLFRNTSSFNGTIISLSISLSNDEDIIILNGTCLSLSAAPSSTSSSTTLFSSFSYTSSLGAAKNNKTLERRADGSWSESLYDGGTPGRQNSIWQIAATSPSPLLPNILITELLPNPSGSDDAFFPLGEWLEFYNNGSASVDLRGFALRDKNGGKLYLTDTNSYSSQEKIISGTIIYPNSYLLVYRNGDSDFSLDNEYDDIFLVDDKQNNLTSISYSNSKENLSWQKDGFQWVLSTPTPFAAYSPSSFFSDSSSSNSFQNNSSLLESCDLSLSLKGNFIANGTNDSTLPFTVQVTKASASPQNVTVRGTIKTIAETVVKEYSPWTNQKIISSLQKGYAPKLAEGLYLVSFFVANATCFDEHPENNLVQQLFLRTGISQPIANSTISIESINLGSDKKARWGEQVPVRLSVYKGNEPKNEIKVWAEQLPNQQSSNGKKISKVTSFLLAEKYRLSTLTIPVQLDANCDQKLSATEIIIIAEGLGQHTEKFIPIEGFSNGLCQTTDVTSSKNASSVPSTSLTSTSSTSSLASASSARRAASISLEVPPSVRAGEALRATAHLRGAVSSSAPLSYTLHGYVSKGAKCYSCFNNSQKLDADSRSFSLNSGEERKEDLLLKLDSSLAEGTYKVKVKFQQEGLKKPKEATAEIYVLPALTAFSLLNSSLPSTFLSASSSPSASLPKEVFSFTGNIFPSSAAAKLPRPEHGLIIYESTSSKSQKTIPYFLIISLAVLAITLLFKSKSLSPKKVI